MANVRSVSDKGDKAALIYLDDGSKAIWTPDRELARSLVGKPIPPDWVRKDGEYGPQAFPPKPKGQGRYRDTKEAFEAEAASRLAWQQVEEERKDRRTALMQAVTLAPGEDTEFGTNFGRTFLLADRFYEWLRSSPAAGPADKPPPTGSAGAATTAGATPTPVAQASSGAAGDTLSGEGEAPDMKPGEGERGHIETAVVSPGLATPSPGFPMSPEDCDHKGPSGRWLPTRTIDGVARCPRCGESALIYRETA